MYSKSVVLRRIFRIFSKFIIRNNNPNILHHAFVNSSITETFGDIEHLCNKSNTGKCMIKALENKEIG